MTVREAADEQVEDNNTISKQKRKVEEDERVTR